MHSGFCRMHHHLIRLVAGQLGLLLLLGACGPKINAFKVEPRRICSGDTVRITFRTRGQPHLLAVRRAGTMADTTTYIIVAEAHGKRAYRPADVVTFSPEAAPALAFTTDLLSEDSLIAVDTVSAEAWPDQVRLDEIVGESGRDLVVSHAGTEAVVGAGDQGNAGWRGLPVSGRWEVRSGLLPGEVPGDPAHAPPGHLNLRIRLRCGVNGARP
jgi:hypothetical protein